MSSFWHHARAAHRPQLLTASAEQKDRMHDLVDALAASSRRPKQRRASTSPGLAELEDSGVVRRWWA